MEGFTQQSTYLTYLQVKFKIIETTHEIEYDQAQIQITAYSKLKLETEN